MTPHVFHYQMFEQYQAAQARAQALREVAQRRPTPSEPPRRAGRARTARRYADLALIRAGRWLAGGDAGIGSTVVR